MEGLHIIGFQSNILPNCSKFLPIIDPTFSVITDCFSSHCTPFSALIFVIDCKNQSIIPS